MRSLVDALISTGSKTVFWTIQIPYSDHNDILH